MQHIRVSEILARLRDFSGIDPTILREKAEVGTEVHTNIHRFKTGRFEMFNEFPIRNPQSLDILRWAERGRGYFDSYMEWEKENKPRFTVMEERYYDDELMITGQVDALMRTDSLPVLVDFKCSHRPDLEIWAMQAHFYKYLLEKNGIKIADHFLFMQLKKDGENPTVFRIDFDEKVLSRCIGEAIKLWEEKNSAKDVA
jgi:hypothetical protein